MGDGHARTAGVDEGETLVEAVRGDEDADVARGLFGVAAAEDDDVALLVFVDAALDLAAVAGLVGRGAGQFVAELAEDIAGEAGAVEALRAVAAIDIGLAEMPARFLDDGVRHLARVVLLRGVGLLCRRPEGDRTEQESDEKQAERLHMQQR